MDEGNPTDMINVYTQFSSVYCCQLVCVMQPISMCQDYSNIY